MDKLKKPHIAVDLDGTLAWYDHWRGIHHIGAPIPSMLARVKRAIALGYDVTVFTARADPSHNDAAIATEIVREWTLDHLGKMLPVTAVKQSSFTEIWDDRAVGVKYNSGDRQRMATDLWLDCGPL